MAMANAVEAGRRWENVADFSQQAAEAWALYAQFVNPQNYNAALAASYRAARAAKLTAAADDAAIVEFAAWEQANVKH